MPPKRSASATSKSSTGKKSSGKKKSKKVAQVEDQVAAPPTLDELLASVHVPPPALRTLDSRSGGGGARNGRTSKTSGGGAIFSTCSHGTTIFTGLLNGLVNMTFPLGSRDQGGDVSRGGADAASSQFVAPNPNASSYSSQRIRTVELAAHAGTVTRLGIVVDNNKPPPSQKSATPASPYARREEVSRPVPKDVLLSCSVDGTVKKWSLPDCGLLVTYKPPMPTHEVQEGDDEDDEGQSVNRSNIGRPGTSSPAVGVNRRKPTASGPRAGGGIDGSMLLGAAASNSTTNDDHLLPVNGFALSADGDSLYVGDDGGFIHTYNFQSGEHLDRIRVHHGRITDLCVPVAPPITDLTPLAEQDPPRAGCILTASDDGFCRLTNPTAKSVHAVFVCAHPVHSICYRHPVVLTGCGDGNIRGFNIHTAQQTIQLTHHKDSVNRLFLVPEGREGVTAATGDSAAPLPSDGINDPPPLQLVADKRIVVSVSDDLNICCWDLLYPVPMYTIPTAHNHNITDVTVDTDGRMHTGCFAGKLKTWDYAGVMRALREKDLIREAAAPKPRRAPKPAPKGRGIRK